MKFFFNKLYIFLIVSIFCSCNDKAYDFYPITNIIELNENFIVYSTNEKVENDSTYVRIKEKMVVDTLSFLGKLEKENKTGKLCYKKDGNLYFDLLNLDTFFIVKVINGEEVVVPIVKQKITIHQNPSFYLPYYFSKKNYIRYLYYSNYNHYNFYKHVRDDYEKKSYDSEKKYDIFSDLYFTKEIQPNPISSFDHEKFYDSFKDKTNTDSIEIMETITNFSSDLKYPIKFKLVGDSVKISSPKTNEITFSKEFFDQLKTKYNQPKYYLDLLQNVKIYAMTPNSFWNFFHNTLCGDVSERYSSDDDELITTYCKDCYCENILTWDNYKLSFYLDKCEIENFNINKNKYRTVYPFTSPRSFLLELDNTDSTLSKISEYRDKINNVKSKESLKLIELGLKTNEIIGDTLIIYFETNEDIIRRNDSIDIVNFLNFYKNKKGSLGLYLEGYSDKRGGDSSNLILSKNRAIRVEKFIKKTKTPVVDKFYFGEAKAKVNSLSDQATIVDRKVKIYYPLSIRNSLNKFKADYYLLDGSKSMKDVLKGSMNYSKWDEVSNYPFEANNRIYASLGKNQSFSNIVEKIKLKSYQPEGSTPLFLSLFSLIRISDTNKIITVLSDGGDNWGGVNPNQIAFLAKLKKIKINFIHFSDSYNNSYYNKADNEFFKQTQLISNITSGKSINKKNTLDPSEILNIINTSEIDYYGSLTYRNPSNTDEIFEDFVLSYDDSSKGHYVYCSSDLRQMSAKKLQEFKFWYNYNISNINNINQRVCKDNCKDYKTDFIGQPYKEESFYEKYYPNYLWTYDRRFGVGANNDFSQYKNIYFASAAEKTKEKLLSDFNSQSKTKEWKKLYDYKSLRDSLLKGGGNHNFKNRNDMINKLLLKYNDKYFYLLAGLYHFNKFEKIRYASGEVVPDMDTHNEKVKKHKKDPRNKSIELFDKCLKLDPNFSAALYMLSVCNEEKRINFNKDYTLGKLLSRAQKAEPFNANCYEIPEEIFYRMNGRWANNDDIRN